METGLKRLPVNEKTRILRKARARPAAVAVLSFTA